MIKKMANNNCAIPAAVPAMPVKPSNAASNAMIRKVRVQLNISIPLSGRFGIGEVLKQLPAWTGDLPQHWSNEFDHGLGGSCECVFPWPHRPTTQAG